MYTITYKEINKELSIEENFIAALEAERGAQRGTFEGIGIYYHLFYMLHFYNKWFMQHVAEQYVEEGDFWFYNFHKQFRAFDMFDGAGFYDRRISEKDNERRNELYKLRAKRIQEARPSHKDYPEGANDDGWNDDLKDFYDNDEVLNEIRAELRPLNTWYNSYEMKENFGGNMDMVVWLTIKNDNGVLYKFMDEFLAMYHGVKSYEDRRLFPEENKKI